MRTRERQWPVTEIGAWRSGCRIGASAALLVAASGAWAGYAATPLGSLGGTNSGVYAINNAGQAVGNSDTAGNGYAHATLWTGGVVIDLNDFLDPFDRAAGWVLNDVGGINDSAWIAVNAYNTVTHSGRAYLMTPNSASVVPEPAASALMLGGLAVVIAMRRRQRRHPG